MSLSLVPWQQECTPRILLKSRIRAQMYGVPEFMAQETSNIDEGFFERPYTFQKSPTVYLKCCICALRNGRTPRWHGQRVAKEPYNIANRRIILQNKKYNIAQEPNQKWNNSPMTWLKSSKRALWYRKQTYNTAKELYDIAQQPYIYQKCNDSAVTWPKSRVPALKYGNWDLQHGKRDLSHGKGDQCHGLFCQVIGLFCHVVSLNCHVLGQLHGFFAMSQGCCSIYMKQQKRPWSRIVSKEL